MTSTFLALGVLAAFALVIGGVRMLVRGGDRVKGVLMIVAAGVLIGNVVIATM